MLTQLGARKSILYEQTSQDSTARGTPAFLCEDGEFRLLPFEYRGIVVDEHARRGRLSISGKRMFQCRRVNFLY